jgi:hypothetical protein
LQAVPRISILLAVSYLAATREVFDKELAAIRAARAAAQVDERSEALSGFLKLKLM